MSDAANHSRFSDRTPSSQSTSIDGGDIADFVERNPIVLVAGATALGLIVAGAISRATQRDGGSGSPRRADRPAQRRSARDKHPNSAPPEVADTTPMSERLGMVLDRISSLDPSEQSQDPWLGVRNFMENVLRH